MAFLSGILQAAVPPGFTTLFDGRSFDGWVEKAGRAGVRAEALVISGREGGEVATSRVFSDFELQLEFQERPNARALLGIRGVPQSEIFGAERSRNLAANPGWRRARVVVVGSRASAWCDELLVLDHAALTNPTRPATPANRARPLPPRGPIQLIASSGEVAWRNIRVREIENEEAAAIFRRHERERFRPIFNGQDLAGWAGDTDSVEANAGNLAWRTGRKGTVYWNRPLTDFVVRLEFLVPPGGNNGLALRYPGTGVPAYDGMGEIQLRDDSATPLDKEERQAHGALYGKIASIRGYQRPVGEWNFQTVTVRGSRVIVELNGSIILDGDVSTLDPAKFMANRIHPGKDRASGYFGFAGHSDPFVFRNIELQEL